MIAVRTLRSLRRNDSSISRAVTSVAAFHAAQRKAITMSTRLYVGNMSFQTTEEDLQRAFSTSGQVEEVKVIIDRDTGRSRGFAFVTMASAADGKKAIADLDGTDLGGRTLRVNEAEERAPRPRGRR
jgi:RNA recognition motif-containing protein